MVLGRSLNVHRYGRSARSLSLLHAGATFLGTERYDVVHCQFGRLGLRALTLREIGALDGKLVVSFRGSDLSKDENAGAYHDLFRKGDVFLPVCEHFAKRLIGEGCPPSRVRVHRSGVRISDLEFCERMGSGDGTTRLISIGRLIEKKGWRTL